MILEMNDCKFCISDPTYVLSESELSCAVSFPIAIKEGHFVVYPKRHVSAFTDLTVEEVADVMQLARMVGEKTKKLIGCEKFYICSICDAGSHFHIHFLPKMEKDPKFSKHVFSEEGWQGELDSKISDKVVLNFIDNYRNN